MNCMQVRWTKYLDSHLSRDPPEYLNAQKTWTDHFSQFK